MKKTKSVQELINIYPSWSKIRSNDQSLGYQVLNTVAGPMDHMTKELDKHLASQFLTTRNLDEIDQIYRLDLPTTFEFDQNFTDPNNPQYIVPTVTGKIGVDEYPVIIAVDNDIKTFWDEAIPNRYEIVDSLASVNVGILSDVTENLPVTGTFNHHLYQGGTTGGYFWVETTGGIQYLTVRDGQIDRAQIILHGKTRKGIDDTETLIFPWDMKQRTRKEWRYIERIEVFNMEEGVNIDITSADINGPYISHWNLTWSDTRRKVDEFWDISFDASLNIGKLEYYRYISDEWEQLIVGFSNKDKISETELLNTSDGFIHPVDIAIQPFTDKAWIADNTNKIYLYDLTEDTVDMTLLKGRTPGSEVQFHIEQKSFLINEEFDLDILHIRPIREIKKYRVWMQLPDGSKFGLLGGSAVAFTDNYWVYNPEMKRVVETIKDASLSIPGNWLFVVEIQYVDDEWQYDRIVLTPKRKKALVQMDLSSDVTGNINTIYFDSDQKLWVGTDTNDHYQVRLISDIMLIDYQNKKIYLQETYDEVDVETNG